MESYPEKRLETPSVRLDVDPANVVRFTLITSNFSLFFLFFVVFVCEIAYYKDIVTKNKNKGKSEHK